MHISSLDEKWNLTPFIWFRFDSDSENIDRFERFSSSNILQMTNPSGSFGQDSCLQMLRFSCSFIQKKRRAKHTDHCWSILSSLFQNSIERNHSIEKNTMDMIRLNNHVPALINSGYIKKNYLSLIDIKTWLMMHRKVKGQ